MSSDIRTITLREGAKTGEIDVHFIRLPAITDSFIKNGVLSIVNGAFGIAGFGDVLEASRARLKKESAISWKCTVDVYSTGESTPWALIAGFILGAIIAGAIIFWVVIRPLQEVFQEIARDIGEIIADKEAALARGEISEDYAASLNEALEDTKKKAEDAGREDWWAFLEELAEKAMIGGFLLILLLLLFLSRRRRD